MTPGSPRSAVADPARLAAVARYGLSGHAGDPDLDDVVEHMARVVSAPMAVINIVGPDRQCYPAERGIGAPETHVRDELSFCAHVVASGAPLSIANAKDHPVFSENPLVAAGAVTSYLGVPLVDEDGFVLGALSVFDPDPREFTEEERSALETQVRLVRALLSLQRSVRAHEWDKELLAMQNQVLSGLATGARLADLLAVVDEVGERLAQSADSEQVGTLLDVSRQLREVVVTADAWSRQLERAARSDSLTGLANRSHFTEAGRAALVDGGAVLFLDLDRFKEVNDRAGHAVGDALLGRLGERLRARAEAAVPGAVVGRLGGDEFAVALPGLSRLEARALAEQLVAAMVEEVQVGRRVVRVTASIGLAMTEPARAFEDVVKSADEAMYEAKARGRGCLHVLG